MEQTIIAIKKLEEQLNSAQTVKSLSSPDVTDHQRGEIRGQLNMLYKLKKELGIK